MKITPNGNSIPIDAYVNNVQDKKANGAPKDKAADKNLKTDTVDISDSAKRVSAAREQLDRIPEVREDKVAELKAKIESGKYEINSEEIADKILKDGFLNDL